MVFTIHSSSILSNSPFHKNYVDGLCQSKQEDRTTCEGEDSSYDSDYEAEESATGTHHDVSRTASDTLGAEFAEYVQSQQQQGYTARVEFGLKLGYTENLVQAALHKLGPNPGQNELLEELIKLGSLGSRTGQDHSSPEITAGSVVGDDDGFSVVTFPASSLDTHLGVTGDDPVTTHLRPVVIDGSNVAMSHGNKEVFSCRGIKICVDWFRSRGHKEITVFVPKWRKEAARPDNPITDQEILTELERDRCLVFTPSRLVGGKRMVCYDDRYILKLASEVDGIVVSNDNYRDLAQESPEFRKVIEERILMYSFVNDRFMPPDDPLGRSGPTLDNFLRMQPRRTDPPPPCPYGKKCTYGNKCKFHHPERGPLPHKSVTERLVEHAQRQREARGFHSRDSSPGNQLKNKSLSLPLPTSSSVELDITKQQQTSGLRKTPLARTKSNVPSISVPFEAEEQNKSGVSKSRSVENVARQAEGSGHAGGTSYGTCYTNLQNMSSANYGLWTQTLSEQSWPKSTLQYGTATNLLYSDEINHGTVTKRLSDPESSSGEQMENEDNLHHKLKRQLTLNPVCDPRLYQMRRYLLASSQKQQQQKQQHQQQQQKQQQPQPSTQQQQQHQALPSASHTAHRPVTRHGSGGPSALTGLNASWDHLHLHQSVTRIASAPDSYRPWPPMPLQPQPLPSVGRHIHRLSSTSDPQLNLCVPPSETLLLSDPYKSSLWSPNTSGLPPSVAWPPQSSHMVPHPSHSSYSSNTEEVRRRLHYHLASIFPEEQVQKAMQLYPDETNPQKICAAILGMFSKGDNL